MRPLTLILLSACCAAPPDGLLAEGEWGGSPDPVSLRVGPDGQGRLDLACIGGPSDGPILVADGEVDTTFRFAPEDASPSVDSAEPPFDVRLVGVVCGDHLSGDLSDDAGWIAPGSRVDVRLGAPRGLEVPCAP